MSEPNGYIIYEGPSKIDKKPIVMIATGFVNKSTNPKTGHMIQTYILRSDIPPTEAVKLEEDASICGSCKHRGKNGKNRTCYVQVQQGPNAVYKAYINGKYKKVERLTARIGYYLFKDKPVRLGSYGDPSAVPIRVIKEIVKFAKNHTGYTHFWKTTPKLKEFCMASADTEDEAQEAQAMGWRTFRVKTKGDPELSNEVFCPAVGKPGIITCETCKLCNGASIAKNVVLDVHGVQWKIDKFNQL